jgi:hypothetical protein
MQPYGVQGTKERFASLLGQAANVERREAVHVFFQADERQDALLVQVRGQGQLHQDAVDQFVGVEFFDDFFQVSLADVGGQGVVVGDHAEFMAGLLFGGDIGGRIDPVADQHGRQSGAGFASRHPFGNFGGHIITHLLGNQFSINQLSGHGVLPCT